ncbi:MAG: DUF3501 family protein [Gammaproteobacteria bacterium]|nr:MAG: DUF3501 family protein [Gammaproteobacteria bacterium]
MEKLSRSDLYSLEEYASIRSDFRAQVMSHKKCRQVHIGDHATLYFEDRLTMHYQVQEMLRAERTFEAEGIQEELDVYNPLIPDGSNWKATFMIEYVDEEERQIALMGLVGIEDCVWIRVEGYDKIPPIADEDLQRSNDDKTSAVHFMRFELTDEEVSAVKSGASISMGIEHPGYHFEIEPVSQNIRDSLAYDLD